MAYQQSQPLGSSSRGGGGGWRALSFLNSLNADKSSTTTQQDAAMKGGAGPVSEKGAADYLAQRQSALGLGASVYDRAASDMGFQNAYAGYTAGAGDTGGKASGNSY